MVDLEEEQNQQGPENLEELSDIDGMPEVPKLLKPAYQSKPYRSAEQKMFVDSGIKDFLAYSGKGFYGVVASMFRVPTFIRKAINNQTFIQKEDLNLMEEAGSINAKEVGTSIGGLIGGVGILGYVGSCFYELLNGAGHKGYFPPSLEFLAIINLLSGAHELGRWSKSKQENLEMKALKAQAKSQAEKEKIETQLEQENTEQPEEIN